MPRAMPCCATAPRKIPADKALRGKATSPREGKASREKDKAGNKANRAAAVDKAKAHKVRGRRVNKVKAHKVQRMKSRLRANSPRQARVPASRTRPLVINKRRRAKRRR